jgi:pimeloyl-ACP methyl ester carboxylesterase
MGRISSLAAAGLFATTATAAAAPRLAIPNILKRQEENVTSTTFANITASADLNWVECYQEMDPNLECTYLTVPLDYEKLDAGTTDIAFVRYFVSEEAEDLLVNPGGPAESGVEFAIGAGAEYSKKWNMNIVGFDPRAVSFSGPKIRCSYDSGNSTIPQSQNSNSSNSLQSSWDTNLAKNKACSDANKDTDAKYIGTLAVVQDMMHFVELQAALRGKDPKTAQINYYGVSYGTLIGQTLTAAYPDRLRRVLLDGNVYGVAHYQGWEPSGIDDFGPGIFMFSKLCFEAGAEWCKLAEGMSSIEEVQARFDAVIAKLNGSPMEAQGQTMDGNKFVQAIGGMMYQSKSEGGFRAMVNATLAAESGDTKYFESLSKRTVLTRASVGNVGDPTYVKTDVLTMITAVDIAGRYPWKTYEDWKAATMRLVATAQYNAIGYSTLNG